MREDAERRSRAPRAGGADGLGQGARRAHAGARKQSSHGARRCEWRVARGGVGEAGTTQTEAGVPEEAAAPSPGGAEAFAEGRSSPDSWEGSRCAERRDRQVSGRSRVAAAGRCVCVRDTCVHTHTHVRTHTHTHTGNVFKTC